jgi:hypothetical protein
MRKRKAKTVTIPESPLRLSSLLCLFLLIVLFLAASLTHARSAVAIPAPPPQLKPDQPYALIFGTVWGPDDRPVYGVKVKIRRAQDKKPKWELYSNHTGEFAQRVHAGKADYVVWADLKDFKSPEGKPLHLVREIPVHVENDERVDVGLHLTR